MWGKLWEDEGERCTRGEEGKVRVGEARKGVSMRDVGVGGRGKCGVGDRK